jgi:hypothetical protein
MGSIKNITPMSSILIPQVFLNSFQSATIIDNVVSKFTSSYRTYFSHIPIDIFISCLYKDTFPDDIRYLGTELQCVYCLSGIVDWIQKVMKKPIIEGNSLDYKFGKKQVLLYRKDKNIIQLMAQPSLEKEKTVCYSCNGTGLYKTINYNKKRIKKIDFDKELILKKLERLKC